MIDRLWCRLLGFDRIARLYLRARRWCGMKPAATIEARGHELLAILDESRMLIRLLPAASAGPFRERYEELFARDLVYLERVVAVPAPGHFVTEFQPTDEVRGLLSALRTRHGDGF